MATMTAPVSVKLVVAPMGQKSHVFVNGEEWLNVKSFALHSSAGEPSVLDLELVNVQVEVEGQVYLSEAPE